MENSIKPRPAGTQPNPQDAMGQTLLGAVANVREQVA